MDAKELFKRIDEERLTTLNVKSIFNDKRIIAKGRVIDITKETRFIGPSYTKHVEEIYVELSLGNWWQKYWYNDNRMIASLERDDRLYNYNVNDPIAIRGFIVVKSRRQIHIRDAEVVY